MVERQRMRGPVPMPVLRRLPKYLAYAEQLEQRGTAWVSSPTIAEALQLTSSTVRQDFAYLDLMGVAKRGYGVATLASALHSELMIGQRVAVAIVGAGRLGTALCADGNLEARGLYVAALFDASPELVGRRVGRLTVRSLSSLSRVVHAKSIRIGILAVPSAAAQEVAHRLVACGVSGILNLAHVPLSVPPHVAVVDVRLVDDLQQLGYLVRRAHTAGGHSYTSRSDESRRPPGKARARRADAAASQRHEHAQERATQPGGWIDTHERRS